MSSNASSKWVPLEANPETFQAWSQPLGLPSGLSFRDLWSLDEEMLQFTPRPVHAVLLLFPSRGKLDHFRQQLVADGKGEWKDGGKAVWYIKQTIPNACGSIGLLHSLLNLPQSAPIPDDSALARFRADSLSLNPIARAKLLDETSFFEQAHKAVADSGQSSVPQTAEELDVDLHFISFVPATGADGREHVVELDGGSKRTAPFDWGTFDGDFLEAAAKIIRDKYIANADGDVNFNIITLGAQGDDD